MNKNWQICPQNDNFSHLAKHRLLKQRYVATPLLTKHLWFLNLPFLRRTLMLNRKQNLKAGKKTKMRKGDLKEKRREETKEQEKLLMNKNFAIECFDVVLFMKQKQRRNKKKEREKKKEPKESKTERQEGRKKEKKERERERET